MTRSPAVALPRSLRSCSAYCSHSALAGWYGQYWWTTGRFLVSTDDAYVGAHTTTLAPRCRAMSPTLTVDDNAKVHAGDVIATIDDGDYRSPSMTARDNIATQQATVERIGKQVTAQQAAVAQAQAQLASAQAGATRAELELKRQQQLAASSTPASRRSSRRRPIATRRAPPCSARRRRSKPRNANVDVLKAQQQEAAAHARPIARPRSPRPSAICRSPRSARRSTASSATAPCRAATTCRPASGSRAWCRSTTSTSTPTSRRRSSRDLHPGQPVSIAVDALDGASHRRHGRQRRAGFRLGVLAAAARQRDRQFHQDRAAHAGAHPRAGRGRREQRLLRPGMSVVVSVDTKPGASQQNARGIRPRMASRA